MPLIQLTVKFGWPSVSESLQKLFDLSPVFQHGWWAEFLKSLFQESKDKQMLREDACFKSIIACLAERIEADAENNQLESATTENRVEEVASLLFVFGNDIILAKFTNAILAYCRRSPKCTVLQNLIRSLEKEKLSGNQFWIQLLNLRVVQLVDVEKEEMPPFTWNQDDAVINGHPQVQAFLRGPNQTMKYQEFTNIAQARSFASTFFGPLRRWSWTFMNTSSRSYTATAKTGGSGRRAYCLIEKTREWYEKKVAPLKQQLEELKKLRNMVNPVRVPVSSSTTEQEEPPAKKRALVSVECID